MNWLAFSHLVGPMLAVFTGYTPLGYVVMAIIASLVFGPFVGWLLAAPNRSGDQEAETFEDLRQQHPLCAWRPVATTRVPIGGPVDGPLTVEQFDAMWDAIGEAADG